MTTAALDRPAAVAPARARHPVVVFAGLMLVMLLSALDSTIVATALPTIVSELGGLERLAWVVTAYLLAQTVVTPLYGKLGDLYGRKRVLQAAIVVFLAGSVLCGASRSMLQLILFRAIQGIGGGGLVVGTQAAIGDIVPPRERGRYQGIFGAVFGVSSIAGPLLGGFFTTHLSWRWIFYVNLPLGAIAVVVLAATLPSSTSRARHVVDYLGAGLLAAALAGVVLLTDLGGTTYPWGSAPILALGAASVLSLAAFVLVERRAAEPVLPPRLFRNRVFVVSGAVGLIVGFAMFGSITYLPLFLQVVRGASPTASGLELLPMMGGMLVTSITAGQLISRSGRYKIFPVAGTAVMTLGLALLSRLRADTGVGTASLYMLVLGMGMGMTMQVLVLAVQNAVEYEDLGVATSGATLFRSIGGSVGTAVLGAIFAGRLAATLARTMPPGGMGGGAHVSPESLRALPAALRETYVTAFTGALGTVFVVAAAIGALAFVLSWALEEKPLRETVAAKSTEVGEAIAMPAEDDSLTQVAQGLAALSRRDVQKRLLERTAERAGVDLPAAECWLLARLDENPALDVAALGRARGIQPARLATALRVLLNRGLVTRAPQGDAHPLTPSGDAVLERLVTARLDWLRDALSGWAPERHAELADLMRRLAGEEMRISPA
ncbi:drug resistance transporter, EmrB/QacA subfamily [Gemmatirosa kalamazoonensis]|uniref:Drug resistance transporter, EmrB/QacA subfamily n=1 Tax=Gemmatirosa kalamazoonensis TaxID=861299 RepID=W0RGE6_9BACT|nr:MDR family MFS transporter [Gemmatirosa kalamazoonensis]AHG89507.1 drug resistance transporter, EmrB/QacA subfamily [Gemmatirosa kalamazoonensis]